jgi:class 3 adenylate cyclase/CheY-like chemotaxis protein
VAVLLISAHSLNSDFILRKEVITLLHRRDHEGLRVFPIIIEPCDWEAVDWLRGMQVLPVNGRPLSHGTKHQIESKLAAIAKEIRSALSVVAPSLSSLSLPDLDMGDGQDDSCRTDGTLVKADTAAIEIIINRDFQSYTVEEQNELLSAMKRFLEIAGDIRVIRKEKGSVKLTLQLAPDQIERLRWAINAGEFAEYGVVDARFVENLDAIDARRPSSAAWLASKGQDLVAPVRAVIEISETLLHDAGERGQDQFAADLGKVRDAGQLLLALVHDVLDPAKAEPGPERLAARVRHELRTPLNHVIGYCDLWLEDAPELLLEEFVGDLQKLKALAEHLLGQLDELLRLSQLTADGDPEGVQVPDMVCDVVRLATPAPGPARTADAEKGAVLVVDDNEANRDLLCRRLARDGHAVTPAEDGRRALELLQARHFDLVLLDIIMPGLNGLQVLERLKADDRLRHVPVIMISSFDEIEGVVHCIERGAEDYLTKPFNPVLLQARINACLEKKRLRDRIEQERQRSDELLHVILPEAIVQELKLTNRVQPRRHENVAVLFADLVGFTPFCDQNQPEEVVPHLQRLIETWEEIALRHEVEKVKTIGDAFMAAAGLLRRPADGPVAACVRCGLDMIAAVRRLPTGWDVRVGIHVGPVVAGVIGRRQYLFDLWGDTVNTAARIESHGVPGAVVLSGPAWRQIADRGRGTLFSVLSVGGGEAMDLIRFDELVG